MSDRPSHAGPPGFVDLPEHARAKATFQRGGESVTEEFANVERRGESTIELVYDDGRSVTVDENSELDGVEVVEE